MRVSMMVCEQQEPIKKRQKSAAVGRSDGETKEQERTKTERGKVTEQMKIK